MVKTDFYKLFALKYFFLLLKILKGQCDGSAVKVLVAKLDDLSSGPGIYMVEGEN